MPRRTGRDRYRTRAKTAAAADYAPTGGWNRAVVERALPVEFKHVITNCRHGVPWTTCTTCSKPRTK